MQNDSPSPGSYVDALLESMRAGADYLPGLVGAILLLVFGFLVARFTRRAIKKVAKGANRLLDRSFPSGILAEVRISDMMAALLGAIVFWVILLVTLSLATEVAGLSALAEWLDRITAHLPNLIAGVTIVVIGYVLGVYVREQLAPGAGAGEARQNRLLGRLAQGLIVATAIIVGLDQVGFDVVLLVALLVVSIAASLTGLAVAFALGARSHVSNLVGVRAARRYLSAGVRVRIDEIEGEVLEFTATQIALTTQHGKVLLPGRLLDEKIVTIIAADDARKDGDD